MEERRPKNEARSHIIIYVLVLLVSIPLTISVALEYKAVAQPPAPSSDIQQVPTTAAATLHKKFIGLLLIDVVFLALAVANFIWPQLGDYPSLSKRRRAFRNNATDFLDTITNNRWWSQRK